MNSAQSVEHLGIVRILECIQEQHGECVQATLIPPYLQAAINQRCLDTNVSPECLITNAIAYYLGLRPVTLTTDMEGDRHEHE